MCSMPQVVQTLCCTDLITMSDVKIGKESVTNRVTYISFRETNIMVYTISMSKGNLKST